MELIKINEDHYVIVDDSPIEVGDFVAEKLLTGNYDVFQIDTLNDIDVVTQKKITHSTEKLYINDFWAIQELKLSEVKELLGVVDVEKKANEYACLWVENDIHYYAFTQGYNQALRDNKEKKYTEEDMFEAFAAGIDCESESGPSFSVWIKSIQSKTKWEVEFTDGKLKLI